MKKFILFRLFYILFGLLVGMQAYSLNINCRNECYDSLPFSKKTITLQFPECPTCLITLNYLYRVGICNGNTIHDIYIESWQYPQGECPCPPFNENGPEGERWKKIITELLKKRQHHNVPWFDTSRPYITLNLKTPPCVSSYMDSSTIVYGYPCEYDSCCIRIIELEVNFDSNKVWVGNTIQSEIIILPFTSNCPFAQHSNVQCTNICEPLVTIPIFLEADNKIRPMSREVNIFYQGKTVDKILFCDGNDQYIVNVRNVLGGQVFSTLSDYSNNILDLSFLSKGIYFIQIQSKSGIQIIKVLLY